jgi:hypothetical protein
MGTAVFCREAMVARREEEGRRWAEVAGVWDVGEDSTRRGRRVAAMAVRGKRARVPATESQRIRFQGSARSGRERERRLVVPNAVLLGRAARPCQPSARS